MITTVNRNIPDQIVIVTVNTDFFIFGYKVNVDGKKQCLVKFEDCDTMDLVEASFDQLLLDLSKK